MELQKIKYHALRWRDFIIEILFPEECLSCGREGEWLCRKCFRSIKINARQVCPGCNKMSDFGRYCRECRTKYPVRGILVASSYDDPIVGEAIRSFKYGFVRDLSTMLGEILSVFMRDCLNMFKLDPEKAPKIFSDIDNVIFMPIPLHPRRLRFRGFNQSLLLVESLESRFGIRKDVEGLIRVKYSKPQVKLSPIKRHSNIKDAFVWKGGSLHGKKIILVDDVATTGSTLNEAARVLKLAGAKEIWGMVVARG